MHPSPRRERRVRCPAQVATTPRENRDFGRDDSGVAAARRERFLLVKLGSKMRVELASCEIGLAANQFRRGVGGKCLEIRASTINRLVRCGLCSPSTM